MNPSRNVLGGPLTPCSFEPRTGFFRDGCCNTSEQDTGSHTVCTQVTQEFLSFVFASGNDLITPAPQFNFPGLQPGDRWCVCAGSWKQAMEAGFAAPVVLESTHEAVLEFLSLEELRRHAVRVS